MSIELALSL